MMTCWRPSNFASLRPAFGTEDTTNEQFVSTMYIVHLDKSPFAALLLDLAADEEGDDSAARRQQPALPLR